MRTRHALFALASVVLLGLSPFATSALAAGAGVAGNDDVAGAGNTGLSLDVTQADGVSVVVTDNGTGVANASVAVAAQNNSTYAGEGDHLTDANGTVALPTPEENVTVSIEVTDGDEQVSEVVALYADEGEAADDAFGQEVSRFVHSLLAAEGVGEDTSLGQLISEFVVANNPGAENRPEHAGPPENHGPEGEDDEGEDDERRGPPEHAGPPEDRGPEDEDDEGEEREREADEEDESDRRGPPEHAGPPEDPGQEDEDDEESEDDEDDASGSATPE